MTSESCQVAVIGAGPYGLAAAAYLRAAHVETRVFGEALEFWQQQMPAGLLLRSSWEASHIADPQRALTLDAYQAALGKQLAKPIPLSDFVAYGQWYQRQAIPDLDQRKITQVELATAGFRLTLADGEALRASRVVVATGLTSFAYCPPQFAKLPSALVSHASQHNTLNHFAGKKVVVVGGGQSAIESAALLSEGGAEVEVIVRAPKVRWLRRSAWLHNEGNPLRRLLYPPTDVGPPVLNWLVAMPNVFKRLPREWQDRIAYRSIRPAASGWLSSRTRNVQFSTGCNVVSAVPQADRLSLTLDNGTKRDVDHVLLATGYRVDVRRYPFLRLELARALQCIEGYPLLEAGFESSVPGLHFLGAAAAWSFGPLLRFVAGTGYTASTLTRFVCEHTPYSERSIAHAKLAVTHAQQTH